MSVLRAKTRKPSKPRERRSISILALVITLALYALPVAAEGEFQEYAVKAAFILSTLKFVDWPEPPPAGTPVNLCILGENPFGKDIDGLQGKMVKERAVSIKSVKATSDTRDCQVVFISGSEKSRLGQVLDAFQGKGVLTIGDTPGYGDQGVIVNFFEEDRKVRFQINLSAAQKSRLKFDSRFLKLAAIIADK